MSELVITFFTGLKKEQLLPLFVARGFKLQKDGSILYTDETTDCKIVPLSKEGREQQGYRIRFEGSVETLAFFLDSTIATQDVNVVAAEYIHQSQQSQRSLVERAKANGFKTSCAYGLFDYSGVGVVITKESAIHFQFRKREGIELSRLIRIAQFYNKLAEVFSIAPSKHLGFRQEVLAG